MRSGMTTMAAVLLAVVALALVPPSTAAGQDKQGKGGKQQDPPTDHWTNPYLESIRKKSAVS